MSISLASSSTQLAHTIQNDTREADFFALVREKGRDDAVGNEALTCVAIAFVRAVYDEVVDIAKDANGEDAAERTFKVYAGAKGKKAYHDRTEGSQKAQVSKFRQLQKAAARPTCDFVDVTNRGILIRQTAIDDGIEVKSSFPALVDVAREQLKQDDDLTDAQLFAAVTKTESTKEVTLESKLKQMHKIAEDIITGEKWPGVIDQSGEMLQVEELLRNKILKLMEEAQRREDDIKLAEIEARRAANAA